ncbi:MAG: tetratricopeptide repeat protein [Bacteroidales bacterium]|nr:tetratricopeptide repeat protein [Bacteroidales bacterium]
MKKTGRYIPLMLLAFTAVILCACGTKKNTPLSRFWQAFTTRYNVYYNGMTNYEEQIKVLENDYQDDYSQHLFIHPAEARTQPKAPQPSGSFDRTIEKMQKAISLHSIKKKPAKKSGKANDPKFKEYLKREEYNPFIHNAWYMLAKAEYMKGDFLASSATFHYISRHFPWKPELVLECQIWEALSYCAMGWTTEADNVLAHVHIDKIEDKRIRSLANLAFANYYIKSEKNKEAIPYLAEAIKGFGGAQKVRLNFLLGQLYEDAGEKQLAYEAFKRAGSYSGSTYRTKFNARIKQSAVYQGDNIMPEVKSLKHMTRYDRNKEYLDQVYYAIGNLYLSRLDTVNAIENYKLAAEKSTRNGIDKAISQLALGGIYFAQHKYDLAQPCYSEAIPLISDAYPNYRELKKRSDVLDELAVYAGNVTLQDSLLRLSKMPLEEQKKVIKKIIDDLKKKEKEEAENAAREEYLAGQSAQGSQTPANKNAPTAFTLNNDKSWYFYNTATKNAGKTAFQQQWGNRKLEDNWRRRNKNTFSFEDEATAAVNDSTAQGGGAKADTTLTQAQRDSLKRADDPHFEEYYLKQIPSTPEQIQTSNDVIQEGLYNMGLILKDKLEDFSAADHEFQTLLERYPDNIYRLDVYYNLYLLCMRTDQIAEAEKWRALILSDFAESKYGMAMKDPAYLDNLKQMNAVQEKLYAETYDNYLNNNNEAVHEAYAEMMRKYPLSKLMPKFMFIDALSYVTQKNYDKFKEVLKEMLERYPETDITPTASAIMKQVKAGRPLAGGGSNARGMQWTSFALSNDTSRHVTDKQFTDIKASADKPQVFVLVFSNDSINANILLYQLARHNFRSFNVRDYDLEKMTFGSMGLLVVKGFANYGELLSYRTVFDAAADFKQYIGLIHPVLISEENFNLLLNEGRSFEDYFRYLDAENEKEVEAKVPDTATDDATVAEKPGKSVRPGKTTEKAPAETEPAETPAPAEPSAKKDTTPKKDEPQVTVKPENPDLVIDDGTKPVEPRPVQRKKPVETPAEKKVEETPAPQQPAVEAPAEPSEADKAKAEKERKAAEEKAEKERKKAEEKAEKERIKAAKEAEKHQQDSIKNAQKLEQLKLKNLEKYRADSAKLAEKEAERRIKAERKAAEKAEKERQDSIKRAEKEREEAIKADQRRREDEAKAAIKAKEDAAKQKERERKEAAKAKEEARKQKERERKEAAKRKEKEREERAKQKERERKERAKQKEQERKEREAARKATKK